LFALLSRIRILLALRSAFEARAAHEAEILVLRQQLLVLSCKSRRRVRLRNIDRLILAWLSRLFPSVVDAVHATLSAFDVRQKKPFLSQDFGSIKLRDRRPTQFADLLRDSEGARFELRRVQVLGA
jgi:hypothetical protein